MRGLLVVALAVTAATASAAPGAAAARFTGKLCGLPGAGELTAAHISGPCKKHPPRTRSARYPFGTVTETAFSASWGSLPTSGAGHVLVIGVTRVSGPAAALAAGRARVRARILAEGRPAGVGSVSEWHGETAGCLNPPSEDCTKAHLTAIVGNYLVSLALVDVPSGGSAAPEDDPEDLVQEETDLKPMVAIAKTVAKAL